MGEMTWDQIAAVMNDRRSHNSPAINEMIGVRDRYNADWAIPIPDVEGEPELPPITPALIAEAVDNVAMLACSVWPYMASPPTDTGSDKSIKYADIRRKILYATWFESSGNLVLRRGYRHLSGYATSAIIVRPDFGLGRPVFEIRDPLGSYPDVQAPEDLSPPKNCGFIFQRSAAWLREIWPHVAYEQGGCVGPAGTDAELWDLVEWDDAYCTAIGILGPRDPESHSAKLWAQATGGMNPSMEISRWTKPEGVGCSVVTTRRVTLDRVASQIAHTTGMVDLMAKIMGLALHAEQKAIFSDKYAIGSKTGTPAIVTNNGQWVGGETGGINLLENVDQIGQMTSAPAPTAMQLVDRLERNMKVSGTGLVPAMGGETYGALRTGRGIDSMMGAAVDPRVQELQEIMQGGMRHLNRIALDTWKGYWPEHKVILQTGWASSSLVEFTPGKHIEHAHNIVTYPIPGMSAESTTVTLGQLHGVGGIGLRTLRRLHPWIDDPELEGELRDREELEFAIMESIKAQAVGGQLPATYVAMIEQARQNGKDIFAAVLEADEKIKEQQAATPPPTPEGMTAPPETMPGLAGGTAAAAALPTAEVPAQIPGPNADQQGLDQLLQALAAG